MTTPPPPGPWPVPPPPAPHAREQVAWQAVAALVTGVAAFVVAIVLVVAAPVAMAGGTLAVVPLVIAVAAIVLGHVGVRHRGGRGMTITGLVIGYLLAVLFAAVLVFALGRG